MVESLYFSCYYAYLLGDICKAQMFFDILRDEMKYHGNAESLKKHQFLQLAKIRESLRTGVIAKNTWFETTECLPEKEPPTSVRQTELVRAIHDYTLPQLNGILLDEVWLYNIEHPCPPYGKVDMVYKGMNTIYPIEVKKDIGEHDLIGQVMKYDLYLKLHLHLKHYEFVQSITLCKTYQPYVLNELKSSGILTLLYTGEGENLKIQKI
jgi:hypothetical protein